MTTQGESGVQEQLDGAVRNKVVIENKAKKLTEQGYNRDLDQCRNKIKNLRKEYRAVKDNNGETGRTCKFYRELNQVLGHRPASVPVSLLDTGTSCSGTPEVRTAEANTNSKYLSVLAMMFNDIFTEGDDIQPQASVDSALIPEGAQEGSSKKRPGDEACVTIFTFFSAHAHPFLPCPHTPHTHTRTHTRNLQPSQ